MQMDLKVLENEEPEIFRKAQLSIVQRSDQSKREKYFFTFADKEGDWFGTKLVNFILRQSQEADGNQYFIYFEKNIKKGDDLKIVPCNTSTKLIRLNKIKLIARKNNYLTIVHMNEYIIFKESQLSKEWQNLIRQKKNQQHKSDQFTIKNLSNDLIKMRIKKDRIYEQMNRLYQQLNSPHRSPTIIGDIDQVKDQQLKRLQERCKNHAYQLSIEKTKAQQKFEILKIQAKQKLHEAQGKFRSRQISYQKDIARLKSQNQQLQAKLLSVQVYHKGFELNSP